jgi:hypothetical protein
MDARERGSKPSVCPSPHNFGKNLKLKRRKK